MSNSTDEYWEIDGVSLNTFAFNVRSIGSKWGVPAMRGDDRKYAFKPGALHKDRVPDSATHTLGMWVQGTTEAGAHGDTRALFGDNMTKLRQLLKPPGGREFTITKRWRTSSGLHVATGKGKVVNTLDAATEGGPYRANLAIDVFMADPFFYGPVRTVSVPKDTDTAVTVGGDEVTTALAVELDGILANPVFTNSSYEPDVWFKVGTAIAGGDTVTVDVGGTTAKRTSDGASLAGAVTHSGARPWMQLSPGSNVLRLTADSGAGSAVLTFQEVFY